MSLYSLQIKQCTTKDCVKFTSSSELKIITSNSNKFLISEFSYLPFPDVKNIYIKTVREEDVNTLANSESFIIYYKGQLVMSLCNIVKDEIAEKAGYKTFAFKREYGSCLCLYGPQHKGYKGRGVFAACKDITK